MLFSLKKPKNTFLKKTFQMPFPTSFATASFLLRQTGAAGVELSEYVCMWLACLPAAVLKCV